MERMSLAARLSSNVVTPQTELWVRESASDIHARLAGVHFQRLTTTSEQDDILEPQQQQQQPTSPREYPRSVRSGSRGSSMAPALIHQSAPSAYPPSLRSCYTDATPTETSISTGLANHFDGVPLLEDNNGVLELPHTQQIRTPVYECAFWFLNCAYISHARDEWTTHVEAHFRGEEPPRAVQCPLCDWALEAADGWSAWNARMNHLAMQHTMMGQTLRTSRPDFGLFQHLWRKRLIDTEDLKELNGGNHNLERVPGNFVETGRRRERREDERRHRRQHVSTVARQGGPRTR